MANRHTLAVLVSWRFSVAFVIFLISFGTSFFRSTAQAQFEPSDCTGSGAELFDCFADAVTLTPSEIAASLYKVLLPLGIVVGIFGIIAAGYSFMTSQGRPDKLDEAKSKLTAAIIGVIFIVLSIVILRVIIRTLLDPSF